jgi:hypothetical protein
MRANSRNLTLATAVIALATFTAALHADDGAASVAAGGIVLRKEPRITMQKEVLTIAAAGKVSVDFDFVNETASDVTTTVAFPIPTYSYDKIYDERIPNFPNFQVSVNGAPIAYKTEVRAERNGKDYYALLRSMKIDVEGLAGVFDPDQFITGRPPVGLYALSQPQRDRLVALRLVDHDEHDHYWPDWKVRKLYYWDQIFPAGATVHIRHEYMPVAGSAQVPVEYFDPKYRAQVKRGTEQGEKGVAVFVDQACVEPSEAKKLGQQTGSGFRFATTVDYILTSANTWKTPIHDFELIVDANGVPPDGPLPTSFCWNGPVTRLDEHRFSAKLTDFVPSKELSVYFWQ